MTFYSTLTAKGKVESHIRSVRRGVPVREDICHGPSTLCGRVASSIPRRLDLPRVSTGPHSLLAVQWASVQPLARGGSRTVVFGTAGKPSKTAMLLSHTLTAYTVKALLSPWESYLFFYSLRGGLKRERGLLQRETY